jgi:hypothetical protein
MNLVFLREALRETHFMLIDPPNQIVGNADVKRAADSARENEHPIGPFQTHGENRARIEFLANDDTNSARRNK